MTNNPPTAPQQQPAQEPTQPPHQYSPAAQEAARRNGWAPFHYDERS